MWIVRWSLVRLMKLHGMARGILAYDVVSDSAAAKDAPALVG